MVTAQTHRPSRRTKPIRPPQPRLQRESLENRLTPTVDLSIAPPVPCTEGDFGMTNMFFVVTRSGDTAPALTVDYATQNGSAVAGTDYLATSGTLSFSAGQTTTSIAVPIIGNT